MRSVFARIYYALGPLAAGIMLDLLDLATFGMVGVFVGALVGAWAGWLIGEFEGLDRDGRVVVDAEARRARAHGVVQSTARREGVIGLAVEDALHGADGPAGHAGRDLVHVVERGYIVGAHAHGRGLPGVLGERSDLLDVVRCVQPGEGLVAGHLRLHLAGHAHAGPGKDKNGVPYYAAEAASRAISDPLLENVSIEGAKSLLVSIQASSGMKFSEFHEAVEIVTKAVGPQADVSLGTSIVERMEDRIKVTMIGPGLGEDDD